MTNPWDKPPIPKLGDDSEDITYAGVGRVMSAWEQVEIELGFTYGQFLKRSDHRNAIREYGQGRIFSERLSILTRASDIHFRRYPNQDEEGAFLMLRKAIEGFSGRRNDVAHGIVRTFLLTQKEDDATPRHMSFLMPAYYDPRRFDADTNAPAYSYSSVELNALAEGLSELHFKARLFRLSVRKEIAVRWSRSKRT